VAKPKKLIRGRTPRGDADRKYAEIKKLLNIKYVSRLMGLPTPLYVTMCQREHPEILIRTSMAIDHCHEAVLELRKRLEAIRVDIVKAVK
jgi:hypothetical protein